MARAFQCALALTLVVSSVRPTHAAPEGAERVLLRLIDVPSELRPGRASTVAIAVTNLGAGTWPARGAVRLAYRLRGEDGGLRTEGDRSLLAGDVPPGATVII